MDNYTVVLEQLYQKFPAFQKYGGLAFKPGLDRIIAMADQLKNPQLNYPSIHIAGTNGKGSTAHILASTLQEAGFTVGLYTSPHLIDFRERIKINGDYVPQSFVIDFYNVTQTVLINFQPSFFEITTLMAMQFFSQQKVDIAIFETGLGGRLDATNIIKPIVTAITPVSLEHQSFLGNTIQEIALEKAGIIKENTPVVSFQNNELAQNVIHEKAKSLNAPFTSVEYTPDIIYESDLFAPYQQQNIHLVKNIVEQLPYPFDKAKSSFSKAIKQVVKNTNLMGRFVKLSDQPMIIADAGHNAEGLKTTWDSFMKVTQEKDKILVFACSNDKDIRSFFELIPAGTKIILTTYDQPRHMSINEIIEQIPEKNQSQIEKINNSLTAVKTAQSIANQNTAILITGSIFLLGEIFPYFFKK